MFDKLLKQAELYALKLSEWFNELDFEIIATFLFFICLALLLLVLIKGVIKTFKRQPIVAILCIIFLFPFYIIWAFCELFTKPINEK